MTKRAIPELLILHRDGREERHPFEESELIIGRKPEIGLTLDDEYLSRKHCRFRCRKNKLSVEDLESYNGTYVNGKKIHERCQLEHGDVVKIGRSRLIMDSPGFSETSLRVYAPDLPAQSGVKPISKTKKPKLAQPYVELELDRLVAEGGPPDSDDSAEHLPEALGTTLKYVKPDFNDEESETPTPIPSAEFTASAISRGYNPSSSTGGNRDRMGLRVIAQLARVMHSTDDLEELLAFAIGRILEVVPAERGLVMRLDPQRRGLYIEACKNAIPGRDDNAARRLGISHTIAKKVIRDRVSVLVNDAVLDERFCDASSVQELQVRSILCTPIWHGEKVAGLIYLDHLMHAYAFTEADREFLVAVANLIALRLTRR